MTKIETTKEVLYHLGRRSGGPDIAEGPTSDKTAQAVRDLGRRVALAAALGPVEIVAVD